MNLEKLKKFVENLSVQTWMLLDAVLIILCILAVCLFLYGD